MADYPLDGKLYYLGRDVPGVIDLLMLKDGSLKVALLFSSAELAARHLARLDGRFLVHTVEKDDFRGKEELLVAGLAQGAGDVWFDVHAASLEPRFRLPLAQALAYIRSYKNETACF